jgi:hypothetical protein
MKTLMTYVIVVLAVLTGWLELRARAVIAPISESVFGTDVRP